MICVTEIKRGGARQGAGRKRADDPTVVIRVPSSQEKACKELVQFGFTSDQVRFAYSLIIVKQTGLSIPGVPVNLKDIHAYGFQWINYQHFESAVMMMAAKNANKSMRVCRGLVSDWALQIEW
ncbi:hypothetical protein BST81_13840 [Leptolyngbya sp. 'hensonii']|uniref:hypothetical protein n=1 Tax=Leptolyngbya sp. 'hensonii' TaxID=1922337 RepID=UPI0009502F8A|nr:hypothetical protein [Leptolyngbya sp. 'hensonii']OLP18102.1 hypothetical protein BST81_13840 [Leptolyngbya sp. 'hensonii']